MVVVIPVVAVVVVVVEVVVIIVEVVVVGVVTMLSVVVVVSRLDILFLSSHNIHKSLCGLCFWASDPLIDGFY